MAASLRSIRRHLSVLLLLLGQLWTQGELGTLANENRLPYKSAPVSQSTTAVNSDNSALPVVFLYTVDSCSKGLPQYISHSLQQALLTQQDSDVIMASNYNACEAIGKAVDDASTRSGISMVIKKWDTSQRRSQRTAQFTELAQKLFKKNDSAPLDDNTDKSGDSTGLWIQSAVRFFHLEDLMREQHLRELLHVEADNLLYGSMASLLPTLRAGYAGGLACTPLTASKHFFTASVLWVSGLEPLCHFNDYLLQMARNDSGIFAAYTTWLTPYERRKRGTLRPHAVNEMSMIGYYHHLYPSRMRPLPVLPDWSSYVLFKYVSNYTAFAPSGSEITGGPTGVGIFDPGSYGQFIGGTPTSPGQGRTFSDPKHIVGQALRMNTQCRPAMRCGNISMPPQQQRPSARCYTAPYMRCGNKWTPLWNLHVHSKETHMYASKECSCEVYNSLVEK